MINYGEIKWLQKAVHKLRVKKEKKEICEESELRYIIYSLFPLSLLFVCFIQVYLSMAWGDLKVLANATQLGRGSVFSCTHFAVITTVDDFQQSMMHYVILIILAHISLLLSLT